jgi:hypothetical protein
LEFVGAGVMRWEEVPAALRERVRDLLAALLRQAAGGARPAEDDHDE